jgi:hypothetical protein
MPTTVTRNILICIVLKILFEREEWRILDNERMEWMFDANVNSLKLVGKK